MNQKCLANDVLAVRREGLKLIEERLSKAARPARCHHSNETMLGLFLSF